MNRVMLAANPEPIELPIPGTALIVVDMQDAYASRGGYRDLAGKDVGPAQLVVEKTGKLPGAARRAGLTVVYLQNGWDSGLETSGAAARLTGTVQGVRHLIFAGIASNVCVESTLRDAYFREYFCVLVRDATQQSGPAFIQDAVIYNVETFLGWVSDTSAICAALTNGEAAWKKLR